MSLLAEIPGYADALATESRNRDDSFVGAPEFICGVEVEPLTVEKFSLLSAMRSPFVSGGLPLASDVALFLWAMSPAYREAIEWRSRVERISPLLGRIGFRLRQRRFVRRIRRLDAAACLNGISAFVARAFDDAPTGGGNGDGISYWSFFASLVDILARHYHWAEAEICRIPLTRLWQYVRILRKRDDPQCILFNPSDSLRSRWLKEQNDRGSTN